MPDTVCTVCGKIVERPEVREGDKLFHLDCYVLYKRRPPPRETRTAGLTFPRDTVVDVEELPTALHSPAMPNRAGLVTALILERPMCEACVAEKAVMSPTELDVTLAAVATVLELHRRTDRCRACGETKTVISVDRPQLSGESTGALWHHE